MAYLILFLIPLTCAYGVYYITYWVYIRESKEVIKDIEERISIMTATEQLIVKLFDEHKADFKEFKTEISATVSDLNIKVDNLVRDVTELKTNNTTKATDKALKNSRIVVWISSGISAVAAIVICIVTIYGANEVKVYQQRKTSNHIQPQPTEVID